MASKKCPKCGEDNPAEAVMCWACYTPLAGGAVAGAKGAAVSGKVTGAAVPSEEGDKKQIDPKYLALGGLLLVGVLAAVVMNSGMLGGSSGADDSPAPTDPNNPSPPGQPAPGPPPPSAVVPSPGLPPSAPNAVPQAPSPYSVAIGPNREYATGTIGIVATNRTITPRQAQGLAIFARNQFARNGKWRNMQIAVFVDPNAARTFATYQRRRQSERLSAQDYANLAGQGVWNGAATYYEAVGKTERFYTPQQGGAWWSAR